MSHWFSAYSLPHLAVDPHVALVDQLPVDKWSYEVHRQRQRATFNADIPSHLAPTLDSILYVDPDDHTTDIGSIVHVYREGVLDASGNPKPISSFLLERRPDRQEEQATEATQLTALHLLNIFDYARLYPYDYPTTPSVETSWIWGGDSILANGGLEESTASNETQAITLDATAGTWTATHEGNTATGLAWDINASTLETSLEAAWSHVISLSVTGAGDSDSPFLVTWVDPGGENESLMTVNDAGLTGTASVDDYQQGGDPLDTQWTVNTNLSTGYVRGGPDAAVEVSTDQARTGTNSLKVIGSLQFTGAQQVVTVVPGQRYQASAWIYTPSSTDKFRVVIRDRFENLIAWSLPNEQTVTPSTWTEIAFEFTPDVDLVVFRVAYVGTGNPANFYLDDMVLAPGALATNLGNIFTELLNDIQVDHTADPRGTFLDWITPTWSGGLDSAGNAWPFVHSITLNEGTTYLQVMEHFADRFGYEFDLWYDQDADQFKLDIFNAGALGTSHPSDFPAIVVGAGITGGESVRSAPLGNAVFVRGAGGLFYESTNADMQGPWDRREGFVRANDVSDATDLPLIATTELDRFDQATYALQYSMSDNGQTVPIRDFTAGDYLTVTPGSDTAISSGSRRIEMVKASGEGGRVTGYDVHIQSEVYGSLGLAAQAEAVRRLLRKIQFEEADFGGPVSLGLGGDSWPIIVAASDSSAGAKAIADYECQGVTDGSTINLALVQGGDEGRPVLLAAGIFTLGGIELEVPVNTEMFGQGRDVTVLLWDASSITSLAEPTFLPGPVIDCLGNNRLADFTLDMGSGGGASFCSGIFTHSTGAVADELAGYNTIDRVSVINGGDGADDCAFYMSGPTALSECLAEGFQGGNGTGYYFYGDTTPEQVDSSSLVNCDTYLISGYGVRMRTAPNLVVDGCTLAMFGGRGVFVDTGCNGAVITNSHIERDVWIASTVTFAGNDGMQTMDIRSTADFSQIIDNTWSTDSEIILTAAEQIIIRGNKFQTAGNAAHVVIHGSGDQIQIIDNMFYDLDEEAIETVGGTDWRIVDNMFDPAGNSAAYIITVDATSTGIRIIHNDAVSGVTGFVNDLGTGTIYHANVVDGVDEGVSGGLVSPLTTKGDIWGFDTVDDRIPVGTDGQVLMADSTAGLGVSWALSPTFSYKIAANDAHQHFKDGADETVDGTDDDVQIQTALDTYSHVILSPGTFDIGAPIQMASLTWLQGSGVGTILKANSITVAHASQTAILVSKSNEAVFVKVTDMSFDGNYSSGGSGCHGIHFLNTSQEVVEPPAGQNNWNIFSDLWLEGFRVSTSTTRKGIWLESTNTTQRANWLSRIGGVDFGYAAIHIDGSSDNHITEIHMGASNQYGIHLEGANSTVTSSKFYFTASHAFYVTSGRNQLSNVQAQDMEGDGFHITGANTMITGAHAGAELSGRDCVSGLHLAASQCVITGFEARIGSGTMDQGINFSSGTVNMVHGVIANANADFDTANISGTPDSNDDIRIVRNGTTVYTG